jgi:hypothetical protein
MLVQPRLEFVVWKVESFDVVVGELDVGSWTNLGEVLESTRKHSQV